MNKKWIKKSLINYSKLIIAANKDPKADFDEVLELEREILEKFGLPATLDFREEMEIFIYEEKLDDKSLDEFIVKLSAIAANYLLAPIVSDLEQLMEAKKQKLVFDYFFRKIGLTANCYQVFLYEELFCKNYINDAEAILKEMKMAESFSDKTNKVLAFSKKRKKIIKVLNKEGAQYIDEYYFHAAYVSENLIPF